MSFAPGYLCQLVSSSLNNNSCGTDINLSFVRDADGRKLFDFQLQNLTDSETFSASLNLVVPLANIAKLGRSDYSAPINNRVSLPPVKGGINRSASQETHKSQKVKNQVMGSFFENAEKQVEFESSQANLVNEDSAKPSTEVIWLWDLSKDSWLLVSPDEQEKEK